MHEGRGFVPYLERKNKEGTSCMLEQVADGLVGERSPGLDGLDGEPQIRGGEKPQRGARRRAAAVSGCTAGAAAAVGKLADRMWLVEKPYGAVYIVASKNVRTSGAYGRPESNMRPDVRESTDDRSRDQQKVEDDRDDSTDDRRLRTTGQIVTERFLRTSGVFRTSGASSSRPT